MSNQSNQNPEYITFYIGLVGDSVKKKRLIQGIKSFAHEKLKKNPDCKFRVFYFKKDAEPFLSENYESIDPILELIEKDWAKNRETSQNLMENGIFYCLSQIAAEASKKKANFRIIFISDEPSTRGTGYKEAVMDLIENVRLFPTFIDIIRIGDKKIYPDDVLLQIVSRVTSGGLFYIDSDKKLQDVFMGLAINKKLPDLRPEGGQEIDPAQKKYYESLAVELIEPENPQEVKCILCNKTLCSYCGSEEDIPMECPQCGVAYHECCAALHSWKFNIGLKHLFRCINCGALIILNEENVYAINGEPYEAEEEMVDESEEVWVPTEESAGEPATESDEGGEVASETFEAQSEPESGEKPQDIAVESSVDESTDEAKTQESAETGGDKGPAVVMGLFGPKFIRPKATAAKKQDGADSAQEEKKEEEKEDKKEQEKPALKRLQARRRHRPTITYCPFCAAQIDASEKVCPHCGSPIF